MNSQDLSQLAYPYYVSVFFLMGATFIFLAFFLYSDYPVNVSNKKQKAVMMNGLEEKCINV